MKISVLIPSWRRPDDLARCLEALARQSRPPDEVLLVVREDDEATRKLLAGRAADLPIEVLAPPGRGVIAALNTGLDRLADCDVVAITDDDTAAHEDWLARIESRFEGDPQLGGLGGRDVNMAEDGNRDGDPRLAVGRVRWFGRVTGYHHIGAGPARPVDILKGANMAWRRAAIEPLRLDPAMRGEGAEPHWEVDLSLAAKGAGWKLEYDPAVLVDHYGGERFGDQREELMSPSERFDAVHNQTYALLKRLPPGRRGVAALYALLVGTRADPGPLLAVEELLAGRRPVLPRLRVATAARLAAFRTWRRWRRRPG